MFIPMSDAAVRLTGRWFLSETAATATACGAYFEAAFKGEYALLHFYIGDNTNPYPHLWISVDGGARIEAPVDRYLRIAARGEGPHAVQVIYKSANENQHRWYAPLVGKIAFEGFDADAPAALPADERPFIEFVGDSITEGILIDPKQHYVDANHGFHDRTLQDDVTAGYAWLTAEKLDMRPILMGYGAVGCTHAGSGSVPRAADSYPYCFNGAPIPAVGRKLIVINHGANDRRNPDLYLPCYEELLDVVRKLHPEAKIVVLSPFTGYADERLSAFVPDYNARKGADLGLVLTGGWISPEPLHPLRDGHRTVAEHLAERLSAMLA